MRKNISIILYKSNRRKKEYNDISCIYKDKTYTCVLDDIKTSINEDLLIRENNEFKFTLNIKEKKAIYLLKEKNMLLDILVEKININLSKSNIILEYKLESDDEITKIELIDKEDKNE